ncbi:MAG: hypothetical protein NTX61_13970 [Bacteroidetes bacterium]|nr:hypothetical protein [Bacteroidota bacterium]
MKTLNRLVKATILILVFFTFGCDTSKEKTETCGEQSTPGYSNMKAVFEEIVLGAARFPVTVEFTDVCIYKNATINVTVNENPGASVKSVLAYPLMDNSTPPDITMNHDSQGWFGSLSLNLRQGFSKNPGNFQVRVIVWIDAYTQAEAQQKYDASISSINISCNLYRPN